MSPLTGTHITYLYMYKYMNVHTYTRMCLSARACIDKMLIQQTAGNQRVTKILKSHEMSWKIQQLDSSGLTEALSQSKTNKFIYGICLRMHVHRNASANVKWKCSITVSYLWKHTYSFIRTSIQKHTHSYVCTWQWAVGQHVNLCVNCQRVPFMVNRKITVCMARMVMALNSHCKMFSIQNYILTYAGIYYVSM